MLSFCVVFNCSNSLISKFYDATDSEHKFHKNKNPQVLNWNPPDWEPTVITITPGSTYSMMESLKNFIYPSTRFWNNPGDSSLPLNCANALKIHSKRPEQHQTPTKTKLHLLNHLQTLHTHTLNCATPLTAVYV